MRVANKLKALEVKSFPPGKYGDGSGLWLLKREDGGGQWSFRYTLYSRRKEMGLGSLKEVTLRDARIAAEEARRDLREGNDPMKQRRIRLGQIRRVSDTLEAVAEDAYESHKKTLKRDDGRWVGPLRLHVLPKLGKMPIEQIDQHDIRDALAPLWHTKNETARKALSRLKTVFVHALALGLDVKLQTLENAKVLLGRAEVSCRHIAAMPWSDVPAFYDTLGESQAELALRLLILTGVRSGSVLNFDFDQIEGDEWVIPAEHLKGRKFQKKTFTVPLSAEAKIVVNLARKHQCGAHAFSNTRGGRIDKMSMRKLMVDRGLSARPHGFRSSLRTWLAEETDCPNDVAEAMLAHETGSDVERAYKRTDFLEKRRSWTDAWSAFVTGIETDIARAA
ncbi:tyrosine-type recombinase/integrase [Roseovarius aquimarinus]|uniref:Tyrosine-type recombinase/integrase n=1 Tax=Roseovarius aquimarinus TaxID=1229156 RepID=A0ABW7I6T4_9RHOB